jgi:hypothetical protein
MALPLLALGKIVSSVVSATAKGLTVAGKATAKGSKVVGRAAGKAAYAGGELVYDVASAAKQGLIKGVKATPNALKKAASATRKSMSNFGKRMSKRKTSGGIEKLKRNSEKIRNNINRDIKKLKKQRLDRERIQRNVLERGEVRKMEKNIESAKTPTGKKVNSILKSPMSIFDKIFGLGGILLAGIVVNAIDAIVKKWEEFKKNNKPMFDFIGNIIKGVGDFLGGIEISMDKMDTDKGDYKKFAVFNKEGDLVGGKLVEVKKTVETLGALAKKVIETIGKPRKKGENAPEWSGVSERGWAGLWNRRTAGLLDFLTFGIGDFDQRGNLGWWGSTVHSGSGYGEEMEWADFFNHEKQIKKKNNDNNIDLSFNTDNIIDTTFMVAYQKEIEYIPFPIGNSGSSGGLSNYDAFTADLPAIWKEN